MTPSRWSIETVRFRVMFRGWHGWLHAALMLAMPAILIVAVVSGQALLNPMPWFIAYAVVVGAEVAHIGTHLIIDRRRVRSIAQDQEGTTDFSAWAKAQGEEPPEQLNA